MKVGYFDPVFFF